MNKAFYFIRHGQTDWNHQQIVMGQQDIPLNATGIEQAQQAAELLKDIPFASIAASPLQRALKTAQIIGEHFQKPVSIINNLKEACWGVTEGTEKGSWGALELWEEGEFIDGAEFYSAFEQRVRQGLTEALELPGPVLVVAHGGVYRALRKILKLQHQELHNCAIVYHTPPENNNIAWNAHYLNPESRYSAEMQEGLFLSQEADSLDKQDAKTISHDDAWKQNSA